MQYLLYVRYYFQRLEMGRSRTLAGENARATERDEMLHFLEEYF